MLILYDYINTIVFVILAFIFMRMFYVSRKAPNKLVMLAWIILEIVVVKVFDAYFIPKALATILLTSVSSWYMFRGKVIKTALLALIEYGFYTIFEVLIYLIFMNYTSYVYIYDLNDTFLNVYVGTFSEILFLVALFVIWSVINKKRTQEFNAKDLVKYSVFPIFSISFIVVIGIYSKGSELTQNVISIYTYLAIMLLVINVYLFWLLQIDSEVKLLKEKNEFFEMYANDLTGLYEQIREEHSRIESIEHEYKNHMVVINSLASSGKTDELLAYLCKDNELPSKVDILDCGNSVVSALFNAKYSEASRKGITVRFDIGSLKDVSIKDTDLVVMISNLFNNAIEACECCEKKIIDIKMTYSGNMFYVSFSNTYDSKQVHEGYKSSKKDQVKHGYGLPNVRSIVNRYDGHIDIIPEADRFTVRVMMFDSEQDN